LSAQANAPVNVDSKVMETTEENLKSSNRWSFDEAAVCCSFYLELKIIIHFIGSHIYADEERFISAILAL
jgi:hypothetical protein